MDVVDDAHDGVVDGHELDWHRLRSFSRSHVVHELSGPGHVDCVGSNQRLAVGLTVSIERLDDQELHTIETFDVLRSNDRSDHSTQLHVIPLARPAAA